MLRCENHDQYIEEPEGQETFDTWQPRLSVPTRQRIQKSIHRDKELQGAEHWRWNPSNSNTLSILHMEWKIQGKSDVLWSCPQFMGI